ncbi:MAG: hypothetical protein P8L77_06165 [Gammaproteobacteria bacterium]|nr:hypothetical protein [Gammaproteobacteria bacterium]
MNNRAYACEEDIKKLSALLKVSLALIDEKVVLAEDTSIDFDGIQIKKGDSLFELILINNITLMRPLHFKFYKETLYSQKFFDLIFKLDEGKQATVFHYLLSLSKSEAKLLCELKQYGYEEKTSSEVFEKCLETYEKQKEQTNKLNTVQEVGSMFETPKKEVVPEIVSSPDVLRRTLKDEDLKRFEKIFDNMNSPKSKNQVLTKWNSLFDNPVMQNNIGAILLVLAVMITVISSLQAEDSDPRLGR